MPGLVALMLADVVPVGLTGQKQPRSSSLPTSRLLAAEREQLRVAIDTNDATLVARLLIRRPGAARLSGAHLVLQAAASPDPAVLRAVLDAGGDPNDYQDVEGDAFGRFSALIAAVLKQRTANVKLLLDRGARTSVAGSYGGSVLSDAMASGNDTIVDLLRRAGAGLPSTPASLVGAAGGGYLADVERLIRSGVSPVQGAGYKGGFTALMASADAGRTEVVRRLIQLGARRTIDVEDGAMGFSALGFAARSGHREIAELLRAAGSTTAGSGYPSNDCVRVPIGSNSDAIIDSIFAASEVRIFQIVTFSLRPPNSLASRRNLEIARQLSARLRAGDPQPASAMGRTMRYDSRVIRPGAEIADTLTWHARTLLPGETSDAFRMNREAHVVRRPTLAEVRDSLRSYVRQNWCAA